MFIFQIFFSEFSFLYSQMFLSTFYNFISRAYPDWKFHNARTSKNAYGRNFCRSKTSINDFWGSALWNDWCDLNTTVDVSELHKICTDWRNFRLYICDAATVFWFWRSQVRFQVLVLLPTFMGCLGDSGLEQLLQNHGVLGSTLSTCALWPSFIPTLKKRGERIGHWLP